MEYKIYTEFRDYANVVEFYIFLEDTEGHRSIYTDLSKGVYERTKSGDALEPTFKISGHVVQPFLQAMTNMLHKQGIRADKEPILENKLTAVKYHLEDMRNLVLNGLIGVYK